MLNLFAECLSRSPGLVLSQPSYVKRVVFPPGDPAGGGPGQRALQHGVGLLVLIGAHLVIQGGLSWTVILAPVVLLPLVLFTLGLMFSLASLGVFLRDLPYVVSLAVQALTFLTPVFYPVEALPAWARPIIAANPLAPAVDDLRRVVLWGQPPAWTRLLLSLLGGLAVLVLGRAWFGRTRHAFADVL